MTIATTGNFEQQNSRVYLLQLTNSITLISIDNSKTQTSANGRIEVKDSQLIVSGGSEVTYLTKQSFSGNYTIEVKTTVHTQAVCLLFGSGSPNQPLWLLTLTQPFGLWAHMPNNWSVVNKVSSDQVKADTPVTMEIDINGNVIKTYINGGLVDTCNIPTENTTGPLGLRFSNSESGDVDYISVTQNNQVVFLDDFNTLDNSKWSFPLTLEFCMNPIWAGDNAYDESVWPIAEQDGTVKDISLLYNADEILSVQNTERNIVYTKGVDYSLVDGKFHILTGSKIKVTSYATYHPTSGNTPSNQTGMYTYYIGETPELLKNQIYITYRHSENWSFNVPSNKSTLLPKTIQRLKSNQNLNIVFYGDSIMEGFNTTGFMNMQPYMPTWSSLVTKSIQKAYPNATVTSTNTGLQSTSSAWGVQNIESHVNALNPDLVVVAFGMNEGSVTDFINNTNSMITKIKDINVDCEIVLVSTMLPNPDAPGFNCNQGDFGPAMLGQLEKEGVAVADVTSLHRNLLTKKKFADMTGNNVNHPNDYMARCYAQTIYQTILGDNKQVDNYKNINYVVGSNLSAQTLDIQLPSNISTDPFPVVVYIHGGAWVIGDKTDSEARGALNAAVAKGCAVVSINYRLAQNAQWPAQIYDCKAAIRYIRSNAQTYHLDPDKIAVWGASAGAHLAQFMGVTNGDSNYEDLSMGNADYSSDVQAVVSYYGISNLTSWNMCEWLSTITTTGKDPVTTLLGDGYTRQQALDASSVTHISKSTVPMFIAHGMNDGLVSPDESTVFADKLITAIGYNQVDTFFPAIAGHADETFWNSAEPVNKALNFLQKRFHPNESLDSLENKRPSYGSIDLSQFTNKYLNLLYATTSTHGTQKLHIILPKTSNGHTL
jgi:acetyl esterase/lipase/lysophospholipase L1-like esterase